VNAQRAVTLVELLVVLVLLSLMASVVGLTMHTAQPLRGVDPIGSVVAGVRDSAIRSGRSVTTAVWQNGVQREVTAMPDGRIVADSSLDIDRLTGDRDATP